MASKKQLVKVTDITAKLGLPVKGNGGEAAAAAAMPVPFDFDKVLDGYARAPRPAAGGAAFLKMVKGSGEWVFGQSAEGVPEDAPIAVNPSSFTHGWIAWRDTSIKGTPVEKLGEVMRPAYEAMPEPGETPRGAKQWDQQHGFTMKRVDNGDALAYVTTSVGGRRAVTELRDKVLGKMAQARVAFGPEAAMKGEIIPIIRLSHDSYPHSNKTFGTIFVPVFEVTGWMSNVQAEKRAALTSKVKK